VAVTRAMNRCYIYLPDQKTEKSPVEQLFQQAGKDLLVDQVVRFAKSSEGAVAANSFRREGLPRVQKDKLDGATLEARSFSGKISRVAMTASFSGLNAVATALDEVDAGSSLGEAAAKDSSDLSIFTFDRGRRTGDFFHDVLEQVDFQNLEGLSELIEQKLWTYGFPETLHRPAINQIVRQLMEVQLEPGMSLRDIPRIERLSEMEFSYPLAQLTPAALAKALRKCVSIRGDIRKRMGNLQFDPVEGFMRGFIDLLFRFKERYYLVDWKSNWLGSNSSDYSPDGMERAMLEHNYYLQYHLYTVAADLFLAQRLPGYKYETHFGGVYYIFLRGIDPNDSSRGIFRDRPRVETVEALKELVS
jgi:exodeoxyribonuclease V beta subunit